jgi:hypothetical protein
LIIKNLNDRLYIFFVIITMKFTSDGEANVKTISAGDPEAGAGVAEVA